MRFVLMVIALLLWWAVGKWRSETAEAQRKLKYKMQKCADAYNAQLRSNYRKWFDEMTKKGYRPDYVSSIRALTPEEIGVEEWETPADYLKMDPDWRNHPDSKELVAQSYSDSEWETMKRPEFEELRKLRQSR